MRRKKAASSSVEPSQFGKSIREFDDADLTVCLIFIVAERLWFSLLKVTGEYISRIEERIEGANGEAIKDPLL